MCMALVCALRPHSSHFVVDFIKYIDSSNMQPLYCGTMPLTFFVVVVVTVFKCMQTNYAVLVNIWKLTYKFTAYNYMCLT